MEILMEEEPQPTLTASMYRLELEPQRKGIFVTQLQERDYDSAESDKYPVVKEKAEQLLESGIHSLQKTLLVKKEVEVEKVQHELLKKRLEFNKRMEDSNKKRILVEKKQKEMQDRVKKFQKFIDDNELKRKRAIQKYQNEVKQRHQKVNEHARLLEEQEIVNKRHEYLSKKLEKYSKFQDYLSNVINVLPENYLELSGENMLNMLMSRYATLKATNDDLVERLQTITEDLKSLRDEHEFLNATHSTNVMAFNARLAKQQEILEGFKSHTQEKEHLVTTDQDALMEKMELVNRLYSAIENIAQRCTRGRYFELAVDEMSLDEKLRKIMSYLIERAQVVNMVRASTPADSSSTSQQRKSRLRKVGV